MTVATNDQIDAMGLGSKLHVWSISIMGDSKDTLDALRLQLVHIFLNRRNWVCERNAGTSIGDITSRLENRTTTSQNTEGRDTDCKDEIGAYVGNIANNTDAQILKDVVRLDPLSQLGVL